MTKSWREVADSDAFLALPKGERDVARRQYFDLVVAPRVLQGERDAAWVQFDKATAPSLERNASAARAMEPEPLTGPDDLMTVGDAGSADSTRDDQIQGPSALQHAAIAAEPYVVPAMKTAQAVASGYPVAETAANLATGAAALPIAGIAGLVAQGAKAAGVNIDPVAVIRWTEEALTYQPRTDLGKHLTGAATWPLEKLDQLAKYLGGKTLDATGSPAAAAAVETAVTTVPFALPGVAKAAAGRAPGRRAVPAVEPSDPATLRQEGAGQAERGATGRAPQPVEETSAPAVVREGEAREMMVNDDQVWTPGREPNSTPSRAARSSRLVGAPVSTIPENVLRYVAKKGGLEARQIAEAELERRAATDSGTDGVGSATDALRQPADASRAKTESVPAPALPASGGEVSRAKLDTNASSHEAANSPRNALPEAPESQAQSVKLPGAQHVGFIDDAKIQATHTPETPIRREAILAPLLKALDVSVYQGRIKGNRILGYYMPHKELVRTKHASDMETVAHEIAHLIDDRVLNGFGRQRGVPITRPWIGDTPEAKTMAAELRSVSYDRRKSYEGFAEYVRLWMTQPEVARVAAPNFTHWFDQFVATSKYGPALTEARRGMLDWFHQDALNRARSKIGPQAEINASLDGTWDRFRQSVVDDLHGVYRMERELKGESAPLGAYETSRLTRASGSITEGALRYGAPFVEHDGSIRWIGKGLERIFEPVSKTPKQLEDFLLYLVGRSAKELKSQGRERLFTGGEINAMLALERPEFKQAAMDYQWWNSRILNFAQAKGLIDPAARLSWRRAEYLPFHRVGTTTERARGGVTGNWHGIKTLTGGTENIRDVLGNMIGNAHMLIDAALKNEARAKIVELAEKTRGGGRFLQAIPPEARPVRIDKEQLKDKLIEVAGANPRNPPPQLEAIVDQLLANAPYLVDFLVKGQAPGGGNVIAVLKGGKPFYYEVADPILYRAVVALNRPAQSALVRWLSIPKRIGQASIVLTPDFQVANIARDTLMGAVMSRAGFRPAVDSIRGLIGRMTKDKDYLEYLANGGGFASYLRDDRAFKAHLERFYSERGINAKTVLDAPDKLLFFLETLFDSFEVSTRLGEYKRLRAQGAHPRHAAYLSREVSTDFAMKGDSQVLGFLYDTVMFLRPAVVSMDRLYRGIAHDQNRGAIAAKAGAIALASAGLYLVNRDNPKYQDLPDWERDAYWHFFVPRPDGTELHFRYPKIWEVGALGSLAERSVERILSDEPKEFAGDLARVIGQQFNLNLVPQAVAPLYEQARNQRAYTGRPIEPEGLKDLQPFKRATPGTSETMRALGMATRSFPEALQVNPVRTEALLRGYLNTWAWYGLLLSDSAFFSDKMPERRLDQYPVIRRFFRQEPPLDTKSEELFYDMLGEARRLKGTMRQLRREGDVEAANEIARRPLTRYSVGLENMARALAARRRKATRVRQSDVSPAEKRNQLDEIQVQMNTIYKHAVTRVRNRPGTL